MPKNTVWVLGWRPKHPYHCTPQASKGDFGYLGRWCLNCTVPRNTVWVLGWPQKHPPHSTPHASKGVFGSLGWWCLNCTVPKNTVWVLDWRPKHPHHCTPWVSKGAFGYLGWWCLNCTMPKKTVWVLGCCPKHPLYPTGQQRCFWMPGMVVFELHDAKNYCLGSGVAPLSRIPLYPHCTPRVSKDALGYLGWWCLNCTMPKNTVWVLGWRPKHPHHCTPQASKGVFGYLGW